MKLQYHSYLRNVNFLVFFVFICLFFIGCKQSKNNRICQAYNSAYIQHLPEYKKLFHRELLDHFPDYGDSLIKIYGGKTATELQPEGVTYSYVIAYSLLTKEQWNTLNNYIVNNSIQTVVPYDSCNLVVYPFHKMDTDPFIAFNNFKKQDVNIQINASNYCNNLLEKCSDYSLPVPDFSNLLVSDSLFFDVTTFKDDFEINVLEAEQGDFIEPAFLSSGMGLPPEWKNGYSKGVVVSKTKRMAIYWVVVW